MKRKILRVDAVDRTHLLFVDHRAVGVAVEAQRRHLMDKVRLGLEMVEHIAKPLGVIHRRMDKGDAHRSLCERQIAQIQHLLDRELFASPFDDRRSMGIEIGEILPRGYVVVVVAHHHRTAKLASDLKTLVRTGVVTHHVTGAEIIGHALVPAVFEHRLQRIDIGVNVAEYRKNPVRHFAPLLQQRPRHLQVFNGGYLEIRLKYLDEFDLAAVHFDRLAVVGHRLLA